MAPKEATTWQVDFGVAFSITRKTPLVATPGRRAAGARSGVMISIRSYALLSALATVACILHAIQLRKQFYSIVIHLAASKLSVTILGNMAFVAALLFAQFMRQIFLGSLRAAELDRLYEKIWFAITETCLALTIFREELKFRFVFLFTVLLFVKVFHWLSQFRVEQFHTELQASPRPARHAEQLRCQPSPARHSRCVGALRWVRRSRQVTTLTHMRINSLMALLFVVDCFFIVWQAKTLLLEGPSFALCVRVRDPANHGRHHLPQVPAVRRRHAPPGALVQQGRLRLLPQPRVRPLPALRVPHLLLHRVLLLRCSPLPLYPLTSQCAYPCVYSS